MSFRREHMIQNHWIFILKMVLQDIFSFPFKFFNLFRTIQVSLNYPEGYFPSSCLCEVTYTFNPSASPVRLKHWYWPAQKKGFYEYIYMVVIKLLLMPQGPLWLVFLASLLTKSDQLFSLIKSQTFTVGKFKIWTQKTRFLWDVFEFLYECS